jgi:hypothetical protein
MDSSLDLEELQIQWNQTHLLPRKTFSACCHEGGVDKHPCTSFEV